MKEKDAALGKPQLCESSQKIIEQLEKQRPLYKRQKEIIDEKNDRLNALKLKHQQAQLLKDQNKVDEECSFTPTISTRAKQKPSHKSDFHEYNQQWKEQKDIRLQELKQIYRNQDSEKMSEGQGSSTQWQQSSTSSQFYSKDLNDKSFYKRQCEKLEKKKNDINVLKLLHTPTFKPNLNQKSLQIIAKSKGRRPQNLAGKAKPEEFEANYTEKNEEDNASNRQDLSKYRESDSDASQNDIPEGHFAQDEADGGNQNESQTQAHEVYPASSQ